MKKQKFFTITNAVICSIMIITLLANLIPTASYWHAGSPVLILSFCEMILSPVFIILDIIGIFVSKAKIRLLNIAFLIFNILAAQVFYLGLAVSVG